MRKKKNDSFDCAPIVMKSILNNRSRFKLILACPAWIWALTINVLIYFLALVFCDFKYEVSDDFIVEGILSGAFTGSTDPHMLFSNILLGYFLKFFYDSFPTISFYFVFLELLGFMSMISITYCIIKRLGNEIGIPISLVFVLFFSDDLYILPSFTKVASAATIAGGVLFLCVLWDFSKKKIPALLLSIALLLSGMLLRHKCFLMMVPFLFVVFVVEVFRRFWRQTKSEIKQLMIKMIIVLVSSILIVIVAFALNLLNSRLWALDGGDFSEYKEYNKIRSRVTDVDNFGYDSVSECFEDLGMTENDYKMIRYWSFVDRSIYTNETLEKIAEAKHDVSDQVFHTFDGMSQKLIQRSYFGYAIVIGCFLIMGLLIILNPRNTIPIIVCVITGLLLLYLTYYNGRYLYRLEYGIITATAVAMLLASDCICDKKELENRVSLSFVIISSLVFLFRLPLYYHDSTYETKEPDEYRDYVHSTLWQSWAYGPNKYRLYVNEDELCSDLYERVYNDSDHYYLFDFETTIQKTFYSYSPWIRVPTFEWQDNYSYFGGVTTMYPSNLDAWEANGIDPYNPYSSIINDNIYLVDNGDINIKLNYLRTYYYPNAQVELIDEVDGFKIWKFYVE